MLSQRINRVFFSEVVWLGSSDSASELDYMHRYDLLTKCEVNLDIGKVYVLRGCGGVVVMLPSCTDSYVMQLQGHILEKFKP